MKNPSRVLAFFALALSAFAAEPVQINWLGNTSAPVATGVSFGVPWPQGAVPKDQKFSLASADGKALPVQTWPLAYWPDGSLKWSGVATVAGPETAGPFKLAAGEPAAIEGARLTVRRGQGAVAMEIDTGPLRVRLAPWGTNFIESMSVAGREVARQGRLVAVVQDGPDADVGSGTGAPRNRERFVSKVTNVTLEQSGPVRAVVKFEGVHKSLTGPREMLPFVVRLYFYAGQESVRMVHTMIYDGDQEKDFIRGLGIEFAVPMREEIHNRHVRFSGEGSGLWAEPIQPATGGQPLRLADGASAYDEQLAGRRVPNRAQLPELGQSRLGDWAIWDSFKLVQANADGFTVFKRTNPQSAWIRSNAGQRASGYAFIGDVSGGLGVSLKNFWQSHPATLEVTNASSGEASLRVWLWAPESEAMDMRHYDTRAHGLAAVYEDVQPGLSTPLGVARTSELTLFPSGDTPARDRSVKHAQAGTQLPLLVATPQYLHSVRAFGLWSLPDRSTPFKKAVEEQLESTLAFYLKAVGQQRWYGFWDFGDVMHSFDAPRHSWRYDLGGYAWDNTELGTDLWLWMSFLRTGRADVFRMAEAMTRHTSEVDCYHLGFLAGLGSRHNVRHWGCGAKEARISMAALKRYYHYLTTDERTGDLMREVVNADFKSLEFDSMRLAQPITEAEKKYPARIRVGPDWLAYVSNWSTEWERTGDTKWRDKIMAGVESMKAMPYWMRSGRNLVMGYDPKTGRLFQVNDQPGSYNLPTIQGGSQVVFELNESFDNADWQKMWLQYCRLGSAPAEVLLRDKQTGAEGADASLVGEQGGPGSQGTPRLAAYVYYKTKNAAFAQRAIAGLARGGIRPVATQRIEGPLVLNPIDESPGVSTNNAAQWGLSAIEILELCKDTLPTDVPPPEPGRGGRGGQGGQNAAPPPAKQ